MSPVVEFCIVDEDQLVGPESVSKALLRTCNDMTFHTQSINVLLLREILLVKTTFKKRMLCSLPMKSGMLLVVVHHRSLDQRAPRQLLCRYSKRIQAVASELAGIATVDQTSSAKKAQAQ
jgi:hypothetical protein